MSPKSDVHVTAQTAAGVIAADAPARAAREAAALGQQDAAFAQALKSIEAVRDFVGSPEHILGNPKTKHGEIAEQVEVGVRRARDYLHQNAPTATFDGVGRTAMEDYLIDGVQVQSKFVNGLNNNLDHVLKHMRKYPDFGRDGSYYHIPRDHYEAISRVHRGEGLEGYHHSTITALREKAQEIHTLSGGQDFEQIVRPGVSQYAEVQQGRIHQTLDGHEQKLEAGNEERKAQVRADHQPGLHEALGAVGKGAAIGAGVRLTVVVYQNHKAGKRLFAGDYTADDWKALGVEAAKGGVQGGIAAGGIYALTQYADLAAPFAGAVVSSTMAVGGLVKQYRAGEITFDEFVELGQLACVEGALVGLASAMGQALCPVPGLGAFLGAVAGRWLVSAGKDFLGDEAKKLQDHLQAEHEARMRVLDREYQRVVAALIAEYDRLVDLTRDAFDTESNVALRLQASVQLARAYNIPEEHILLDEDALDAFMLE